MKNEMHYSPEALRDLDEIWDYIALELSSPSAAENTVNGIMDTADKLKEFAKIGAPLSSIVDVETDYRFLLSGSYILFYRAEGTDIFVDRILYAKRDYLRVLFSDQQQEDK